MFKKKAIVIYILASIATDSLSLNEVGRLARESLSLFGTVSSSGETMVFRTHECRLPHHLHTVFITSQAFSLVYISRKTTRQQENTCRPVLPFVTDQTRNQKCLSIRDNHNDLRCSCLTFYDQLTRFYRF